MRSTRNLASCQGGRLLMCLVLLTGFTLRLFAQNPDFPIDPKWPKVLEAWAAAKTDAERAAVLVSFAPVERPVLRGMCDQGEKLQVAGNFPAAKTHFEACFDLARRLDDPPYLSIAPQLLGALARMEGRYEDAERSYRLSLDYARRGAETRTPIILNNLANIYASQARYEEALAMLAEVIGYNQKHNITNDAAPFQNTGSIYGLTGDFSRSLSYFLKAQAIYEMEKDDRKLALVHHNIGILAAKQGNFQAASSEFSRAEEFALKAGDRPVLSMIYSEMGRMRGREGKTAEARAALLNALGLARQIGFRAALGDCLLNLGNFELEAGDSAKAVPYFDEALALSRELKDAYNQGLALRGLGLAARNRREDDATLRYANEALELARKIDDRDSIWQSETLAGIALRDLGKTQDTRAAYQRAIALIEQQRGVVAGGEVEKQRFFEHAVFPYQDLALLEARAGNTLASLQAAERTRARVLLDILDAGPRPADRELSDTERAEETDLRVRIAAANARVSSRRPAATAERDKIWHEYEAFLAALYTKHPELRTWRGESSSIAESDLARLVPNAKTVALEFLSGQEETLLFTVTRSGQSPRVRIFHLPVGRSELSRRAGDFRRQLEARDPGFRASARALFDLLLGPAAAELRDRDHVTLVADGPLWELPFGALLSPANRYWIEDASLTMAPSFSFLRDRTSLTGATPFTHDILVMGNPARAGEPAIPEIADLVRNISDMYPRERSVIRTGSEARETNFRRDAPSARTIHIAAHGVMDQQNPLHSRLLLTPEAGRDDGWLEAWELMRMNLTADLVILSACESGRGRAAEGEGLVGLSWTLFVAGIKTAIVSQWRVDSAGTTELMTSLHQHLRRNERPADALRAAILTLMKDPRYRHPMYWSAFVAAGR